MFDFLLFLQIVLALVYFFIAITESQISESSNSVSFDDLKESLFGQADLTDLEEKQLSDHERLVLKELITNITDIFKPITALLSDTNNKYSPKEIYNIIEFAHLQQQNYRNKYMIP